jgi:hypothetical protein
MVKFNEEVLRKPEMIKEDIKSLRTLHPKFANIADIAEICLKSKSANEYLEQIGAEAIGAVHSKEKHKGDGKLDGFDIEVKPKKQSPGVAMIGCINDDTAMILLKSHKTNSHIVFLNAPKDASRINYALCVPYKYFEAGRYKKIVQHLKLNTDNWKWGETLPTDPVQRLKCLEELVKMHQKGTYVRSSNLTLDVIKDIPKEEVLFWKHPDLEKKKLHKILQTFC